MMYCKEFNPQGNLRVAMISELYKFCHVKRLQNFPDYRMFHIFVSRENQVHEVIRLCDQTSWDPQHGDGHGGMLSALK